MDHQLKPGHPAVEPLGVAVRLEPVLDPVDALARFADLPHACLLHSAAPGHPLSRHSFLTADPIATIMEPAGSWPAVRERIRSTIGSRQLAFPGLPPFQGGWIGWLSYELGTAFDRHLRHPCQSGHVPDVALGLYDWVIAWDHLAGETWLISSGVDAMGVRDASRARQRTGIPIGRWNSAGTPANPATPPDGRAAWYETDFTSESYQRAVATAIEHVLAGDIFQVNLAQRFRAGFVGDPLSLYRELASRTAAPMAAYVQHGGVHVISASPEQFLRFDPRTGQVETRPIKGTRPRGADQAHDRQLAVELESSEKDRAENVMIVDLLRNDLARVCTRDSIRVPRLNEIESFPTVHHLVSTVTGALRPGSDALDLLAATFPGGSVTGAPKLRAMSIITELETVARGVYSGSVAWIGLDGAMDSSIAIRTITLADGTATWHAGGAITAESTPADEFRETLDKARALTAAVTGR